jgi:ATP dependent DNA ligase domain
VPRTLRFVDHHAIGAYPMAPMSLYSRTLPTGFIPPCLPSNAAAPPSGKLWLHEVKHDGFRVIARKNGKRVKLYSRPGNDLTWRFPLIVEAVAARGQNLKLPHRNSHGGFSSISGHSRAPSWILSVRLGFCLRRPRGTPILPRRASPAWPARRASNFSRWSRGL